MRKGKLLHKIQISVAGLQVFDVWYVIIPNSDSPDWTNTSGHWIPPNCKWMMQNEGYLGNKNEDALYILLAKKESSMEEKMVGNGIENWAQYITWKI